MHVYLPSSSDPTEDPPSEAILGPFLDDSIKVSTGPSIPDSRDYEILVTGRPTEDELTASAKLRVLVIPWSGLPVKTGELMRGFPEIAIHNLHYNAGPVAEMTMALLLAASKRILPIDRQLRENDWTPRYERHGSTVLHGSTAVILGYGAIGQRVARLAQAFDMQIKAVCRHPRPETTECAMKSGVEIFAVDALHDLLPLADALIVCLPLTHETKGLVGTRELARLPRGSILVNIGRGPVVDQEALFRALSDPAHPLGAAGLDVWYNYPADGPERLNTPPSDFPFHELDNVVMSPHRGGSLDSEVQDRLRMESLAGLLNAASRGEEVPNRVDLARGY